MSSEVATPKSEDKPFLGQVPEVVGGIAGIAGGFAIANYVGIIGLVVIVAILAIPFWAGKKYASWYVKRKNPSLGWVEVISWANVLTWLLPPLGMLTSSAVFEFNHHNSSSKTKYKTLAIMGFALSLLNAVVAIIIQYDSAGE